MKTRFIHILTSIGIAVLGTSTTTAAETYELAQVFGCNYLPGKDISDTRAARDFALQQHSKIDSEDLANIQSYLWKPLVTNTEYDEIWIDYFPNLNAYGRSNDAYTSSEHSAAAEARFQSVSTCENTMRFSRAIYNGDSQSPDPAIVQSLTCSLKPGKSMTDIEQELGPMAAVMDELGQQDSVQAYMQTPFIGETDFDVIFFFVYANMQGFSSSLTDLYTTAAGQAINERMGEIQDCEMELWETERMFPGPR